MNTAHQIITMPIDMQSMCWFDDVSGGWWFVGYGFEVYLYSVAADLYHADYVDQKKRRLEAAISVRGCVSAEVMETRIVNELLQHPWLWEGSCGQ